MMTINKPLHKPSPILTTITTIFGVVASFLVIDELLGVILRTGVFDLSASQLAWRIAATVIAIVLFVSCLVLRRKR